MLALRPGYRNFTRTDEEYVTHSRLKVIVTAVSTVGLVISMPEHRSRDRSKSHNEKAVDGAIRGGNLYVQTAAWASIGGMSIQANSRTSPVVDVRYQTLVGEPSEQNHSLD
jgi:hypothetical protein